MYIKREQNQSILFLTRLYHPHIGGVEKHVKLLSEGLEDRGFDVTIITERFDKKLPLFERIGRADVYRIPIGKNQRTKKFYIWKWMILHLPLIRGNGIIHVHDVYYWLLPIRLLILTKKVFVTFHGYEGYPLKRSWIWQRKIAEKLSNGSICVGKFMKKWYFSSPTSVIYGAVRLTSNKFTENSQSAVFFGRLDSQTGILEYVKAYGLIRKKYPDFKFTIIGEGELAKKIPKDIKLLKFTHDVSIYIGKSRFIFVSRYLSMLEALVQKKEIIAVYTDPIMKDYLQMSPFSKYISINKNGEEIAKDVIKRMSQKPPRKKIENGYDWGKKQTWNNMITIYMKLWQ